MSIRLICFTFAFVLFSTISVPTAGTSKAQETDANVQATSKIEPTGNIEKVRGGFEFLEGPAWDGETQTLFFTDIPPSTIFQLTRDGTISRFQEDSNHSNGLLVTADRRLLACEMDGGLCQYDLAEASRGHRTRMRIQYEGKRFNACNDLVLDTDGGIYFTDPLFRAPTPLPQGVQAVYYLAADGAVSRVTGDLAAPNGIALSPDGKTLYVIPSQQAEMLAYDVDSPGKLSGQRVFCTLKQPEGKSGTGGDGMVVDVEGNLYITSNLGVQIFGSSGDFRGLVSFPEQPANVTLGGPDRKTMYVTARTSLYRVAMPIAGLLPN